MSVSDRISDFLAETRFAVVGASTNRRKYGNKCLRAYLQNGRAVVGVNPRADEIEGVPSYASLVDIPEPPGAVSIITPPRITEDVVEQAGRLGIHHVWMQPGAESETAVARAHELGMNVISGGPCLLVVLGFRE